MPYARVEIYCIVLGILVQSINFLQCYCSAEVSPCGIGECHVPYVHVPRCSDDEVLGGNIQKSQSHAHSPRLRSSLTKNYLKEDLC